MSLPNIVLSGTIGAGKSTAAVYLSEKYDYVHLSYVEKIWKPILAKRKVNPSRENLQDLGEELMQKHGLEGLARLILPYLPKDRPFVIDDIRSPVVLSELRECIRKDLILVFIDTSAASRTPRLQIRDNLTSADELRSIESRITEKSIPDLEACADIVVVNNGSKTDFYKQIDQFVYDFS